LGLLLALGMAALPVLSPRSHDQDITPSSRPAETNRLEARRQDGPVALVFAEAREFPIGHGQEFSARWRSQAEAGRAVFRGRPRPGEFYVFQIGVHALKDTGPLALAFADLTGNSGCIPASALRCLSLGGTNHLRLDTERQWAVRFAHVGGADRRPIDEAVAKADARHSPNVINVHHASFYLEGLRWLADQSDFDGIYVDDTAQDATSLRRARRILDTRPGRLIDLHSWNHFNRWADLANNLTMYMEILPFCLPDCPVKTWKPGEPLPVAPQRGWFLVLDEVARAVAGSHPVADPVPTK
jgi:hypothetical protein